MWEEGSLVLCNCDLLRSKAAWELIGSCVSMQPAGRFLLRCVQLRWIYGGWGVGIAIVRPVPIAKGWDAVAGASVMLGPRRRFGRSCCGLAYGLVGVAQIQVVVRCGLVFLQSGPGLVGSLLRRMVHVVDSRLAQGGWLTQQLTSGVFRCVRIFPCLCLWICQEW